jgi:hypothetical protein
MFFMDILVITYIINFKAKAGTAEMLVTARQFYP